MFEDEKKKKNDENVQDCVNFRITQNKENEFSE